MLSKMQKTWLWIFGAMFVVPEVVFWFTPLSIISFMNNFSEISVKPLAYYFTNPQFFVDHASYLFIALGIEWLGVLGLLVISMKLNKKILAILLGVFLIWLSILFALAHAITNMGF